MPTLTCEHHGHSYTVWEILGSLRMPDSVFTMKTCLRKTFSPLVVIYHFLGPVVHVQNYGGKGNPTRQCMSPQGIYGSTASFIGRKPFETFSYFACNFYGRTGIQKTVRRPTWFFAKPLFMRQNLFPVSLFNRPLLRLVGLCTATYTGLPYLYKT